MRGRFRDGAEDQECGERRRGIQVYLGWRHRTRVAVDDINSPYTGIASTPSNASFACFMLVTFTTESRTVPGNYNVVLTAGLGGLPPTVNLTLAISAPIPGAQPVSLATY